MHKINLFEEYRLIERSETEVNGAWKGAHLLLFFLAFVFGSFCTFCFHMLTYLFDEKCVLFPKLISMNSMRLSALYDFIPPDKDTNEMFPVDFLSTQWVDKTVCYLPTYVPLVSGIFGLVWTTMFLMCSTGSRTLTGLQRPWRILPPVFIFSLAMGSLCTYTSAVTHYGLQELCLKLGEFTGSTTCTFTINVATLAYERRIRGVFQATRLTILTAWLHTSCWLLSALLALIRVIMAVDFQLVKINVQLSGDMDKMLERHERQVRTISPVVWFNKREDSYGSLQLDPTIFKQTEGQRDSSYLISKENEMTKRALVAAESEKLDRLTLYKSVPLKMKFIIKMVYDLVESVVLPDNRKSQVKASSSSVPEDLSITRQYGQENITSKFQENELTVLKIHEKTLEQEADEEALAIKQELQERLFKHPFESPIHTPPTSRSLLPPINNRAPPEIKQIVKSKIIDDDMKPTSHKEIEKASIKSSMKHKGVQTDKKVKSKKADTRKVQITDIKDDDTPDSKSDDSSSGTDEADNKTQTKDKQKQD